MLYDNYPLVRVSSRSKDHILTVPIPKNHHPDFLVKATGFYIEHKGYVRDNMWWKFIQHMPQDMKATYKVVLQNPGLQSPLANMSYGDFLTAYGIDWSPWPRIKDEWLGLPGSEDIDNSKKFEEE